MKTSSRLSVFIFIFFFFLFLPQLNAEQAVPLGNPEITISMDFQDANLKDVLKVFSIQSGLNFIASEAVQDRKITLYMDKVSIKETMDKIFRANNLSYELDRDSNIFLVKDWGKPSVETLTKVFYLKHATVSSSSLKEEMKNNLSTTAATTGTATESEDKGKWKTEDEAGITRAVKKILSENGWVIEDFRTNSLIVTDIPSRMPIVAKTIAALDIQVPQIMLEVEMLDVNKNKIDKIGMKFMGTINATSYMFTAILKGAKVSTAFPFDSSHNGNTKALTPGSLDFFNTNPYTVYLDFIKQQADTKILARPRILTLNNETAEIKISTQEAIGTITMVQGVESITTTTAERVETGVHLRVTPQIDIETGEITMFIYPKVADATASTFNADFKDPEERSTKTVVRVKDGETVIIGGLIRNERSETVTKLPILGDIPLLGKLFTHRFKDKDKERELLVFITPHIVKDKNIELAQAKNVALPEREQNTVSGIDRREAINTSLNKFEKKKK